MSDVDQLLSRFVKPLGVAAVCCVVASASFAATITSTTDFVFSGFSSSNPAAPALPFSTFEGSFTVTYDTDVAVTRQAVDSITIANPMGIYSTSNVFFDYDPDSMPGFDNFSLDVYFDEGSGGTGMPVAVGNSLPPDFLIQSAGLTFQPGILFQAISLVSHETFDFYFSDTSSRNDPNPSLVSTVTVAPVPLPASIPLLLSAFGGLAVLRRRKAIKS